MQGKPKYSGGKKAENWDLRREYSGYPQQIWEFQEFVSDFGLSQEEKCEFK